MTVAVPVNPAPGTSFDGHIHFSGGSQDSFRYVFNEQTVSPDGSITVYAAHEYLLGPTAVGDLFIGKSACGVTASPPTTATFRSFTASVLSQGVLVRWRTGSETSVLGFNVWRYRNGKGVKVNRSLIPAKRSGEPRGASYSFVDHAAGAKRGLTYRLQLVDPKGRSTRYATVAVAG